MEVKKPLIDLRSPNLNIVEILARRGARNPVPTWFQGTPTWDQPK